MPPKDSSDIPSVLPSIPRFAFAVSRRRPVAAASVGPAVASSLLLSSPHPDALTHLAVKSPGEAAPPSLAKSANQPRRRRAHSCME